MISGRDILIAAGASSPYGDSGRGRDGWPAGMSGNGRKC
jgi:hypothetical protein